MRRPTAVLRLAALATSAGLVLLSAAPGTAAQPLAKGTATGLEITVGGTPTDSGSYQVTNDGSGESRSGSRNPQVRVLGGQSLVSAGTLAQNAATRIQDGDGQVVACAGLAGDGATLAEVGEGNCLSPGQNLQLNAANFDLSKITVLEGESLGPLQDPQEQLLTPVRAQVLDAIDDAVQEALTAIGNPGVFLDLGAIQSSCEADARRATGGASLADAGLYVQLPGDQRVDLLSLPVNPPPNTHLVTDLDVVVDTFNEALQEQLSTGLEGALAPLGNPADQLFTQINDNIVKALAPQLAPLEKNLLDVTLNKQVRGDRSIAVTALDLKALQAASDAAGTDLLSAKIGAVTCATADAVAPPRPPANPRPPADVPTSVPSGLADAPADDSGVPAGVALAGIALVAVTIGVGTYRRRLTD